MTTLTTTAPTSAEKLAQNAEAPKVQGLAPYAAPHFTAEPKLDGWRMLVHIADDGVHLYSRTAKAYTGCLPEHEAELAERLPAGTWLDCEAVGMTMQDGKIAYEWGIAQSAFGGGSAKPKATRDKISLMVFDLIALDGIDARRLPYAKRRALLESLFAQTDLKRTILIPQVKPTEASLNAVLAQGFEGLVIKDTRARYASGKRGAGWTKIKPADTIDVIVMGFKPGENGFAGMVGAIIFGAHDADGNLVEAGRCSGMDMKTREAMTKNPDAWIGTVVEVAHMGQMPTGGFRHPQFKKRRPDKPADDCKLELLS